MFLVHSKIVTLKLERERLATVRRTKRPVVRGALFWSTHSAKRRLAASLLRVLHVHSMRRIFDCTTMRFHTAYSTDSARYTSRISERFLNDDKDLIYHLRTCFHQHFHQAVLCGFSTHASPFYSCVCFDFRKRERPEKFQLLFISSSSELFPLETRVLVREIFRSLRVVFDVRRRFERERVPVLSESRHEVEMILARGALSVVASLFEIRD